MLPGERESKLSSNNTTANKSQSINKISYHNYSVKNPVSSGINYSHYNSNNLNIMNNGNKKLSYNEVERANKYSSYHK